MKNQQPGADTLPGAEMMPEPAMKAEAPSPQNMLNPKPVKKKKFKKISSMDELRAAVKNKIGGMPK